MPVFTCRTLRIGWGSSARAAAMAVAIAVMLALMGLGPEASAWLLLGTGCIVAAFIWLSQSAGRSVHGHVLELAHNSIRIHPGEGRRADFPQRRVITPESVADGYALTPSRVVLTLRSGATIDADLETDSAQEVLDHLGVTAAQRVLRTPLTSPIGWLEIGLDGVRIATRWRSRFIPYGNMEKVTRTRKRIAFKTTSRKISTPHVVDPRAIPALVSRIEDRRAAAALAGAPPLDVLDRQERPIGEWRAALDELALGRKGFRGAALRDDDLQRILDDPTAPLEQRIGAALALRSRGGDAQGRIRVTAETSVERRVRVALEAASADDIDDRAIERALDKAESRRVVAVQEPHESEE